MNRSYSSADVFKAFCAETCGRGATVRVLSQVSTVAVRVDPESERAGHGVNSNPRSLQTCSTVQLDLSSMKCASWAVLMFSRYVRIHSPKPRTLPTSRR